MIVKKLRLNNKWSQEQLAQMSGLSTRTIQRVESGQKASLETLKSLAAVFEIDIETLTKEITVIDKTTEKWRNLPWFFRLNMLGIYSRRSLVGLEWIAAIGGLILLLAQLDIFKRPEVLSVPVLFLSAYCIRLLVQYGDKENVW